MKNNPYLCARNVHLPIGDTHKKGRMNMVCDTLQPSSEPIVNGTTVREAYPKRWIAALVQMCTEKRVSERLTKLRVENYVPTQTEIHQWSDRKKKIERIVIPMIVFIRTDGKTERQLRTHTFIRKILTYPGQYASAVIPDEQIEQLKFMLKHADSKVEMAERLEVGEKVRIARGPLKDLEGELCYVEADKPMVAIRIECLGYACVNIDRADIERILTPSRDSWCAAAFKK